MIFYIAIIEERIRLHKDILLIIEKLSKKSSKNHNSTKKLLKIL